MNEKVLLIISVITASIGQVLFKKGMSLLGDFSMPHTFPGLFKTLTRIMLSPTILTGLFFYGLSTLVWLAALSKTRLNYAYPYTALTFILVMLASRYIFLESMPLNRIIGVVLICCGFIAAALK